MKNNLLKNLGTIIIRVVILLMPLFFLPWSASGTGMDSFGKYYFLWLMVPLAIFIIGFDMFKKGEFKIKFSGIETPVLFYAAIVSLSAFFSYNAVNSFYGFTEKLSDPVMAIIVLILFFYLILNYAKQENEIKDLLKYFFYGYVFLVTTSLLLVTVYWLKIMPEKHFVFSFMRMAYGYMEDISMYVAVANTLLFGIFLKGGVMLKGKIARITFYLSFILLSIVNFFPSWIILAFGMLVTYLFYIKTNSAKNPEARKFTTTIIIPLIFIIFHFFSGTGADIDRRMGKLQLGHIESLYIAKEALISKPLLGFGPENFHYSFSLLRNKQLNETPFWYIRFNEASSYMLDLAITAGLAGLLSYSILILWLVYILSNKLKRMKSDGDLSIYSSMFFCLLILIAVQIFYSANSVLLFLFWFLAALCLAWPGGESIALNEKTISKSKNLSGFQAVSSFLVFLCLSCFIIVLFGGKYLAAESFYRQAKASDINTEKLLLRAVELNPNKYNYHIALSKYYKDRALIEINNTDKALETENDLNNSIEFAEKAILLAPNSILAYETYGMIYRQIGDYSPDGLDLAINAFRKAISLEPTNPVLITELGRIYRQKGMRDKAKEYFELAIQTKSDYLEAKIGLAKIHIERNENDQATGLLENINNKNLDVYYELGRAYFNAGNYTRASENFRQVIAISPLHANGIYSLGLTLEKEGKIEEALSYFKKVRDLNPDNDDLQEKIEKIEESIKSN